MAFKEHIPGEAEPSHEYRRVKRIKSYITGNLSTDLSAAVVAKKFELSISSLQHIFKKHEHQSYYRYVEKVRMRKAMQMIKAGKWIQEIMDSTGYKNRITFFNAFKRMFKHSPRYFQQ